MKFSPAKYSPTKYSSAPATLFTPRLLPRTLDARLSALLPPLLLVPWLSLAGVLGLWLLVPGTMKTLMYLPLLLSTVLLGIPHGALDHLVPRRLGWAWSQRPLLLPLYVAGYALLAAVTFGLWRVAPLPTFWGFLLMSLLHWGHGDLHYLETSQRRRRVGPWSAPLTLLARGSLPILVPLLVFPEWFGRLASGVQQVFGLPALGGPLLGQTATTALTLAAAVILLAYALDCLFSSRNPLLELAETALLLMFFVVVPAPLAIGSYFALWHAWRHLGRLLALQPTPNGSSGRMARSAAVRLALDLLPITLAALVLLAGVYVWAAPRIQSVETFAALYLALIAALTAPHALLVTLMDD